jgi:nicotinamide phosphoribosyltransferase
MYQNNIVINTDAYKTSQFVQYPPGTKYVSSYIESRGGRYDKMVFFGAQMLIKNYLTQKVTKKLVDRAERKCKKAGIPFNREGWDYIVDKLDGKLPVEIRAVKEGTIIESKNVMLQIINTDEKCFWLTSYLETMLLRGIWYPTTVATQSWSIKQDILKGLRKTSENPEAAIEYMLNDFGSRGVSSQESAILGGLAHFISFTGSDNMIAFDAGEDYFGGFNLDFISIPASEHSTITSWGQEFEVAAFENMLEQFAGKYPIVACVSDSYNIYRACTELWGTKLKDRVINCGSRIVVRPDSGDPTTVPIKCVELLMEKFGYTVNKLGYKVLPDYIRVIQGDGINQISINEIMNNLIAAGLSIENVCFGMGGALLQGIDRDTNKFAMKCSAIIRGEELIDVYKDPIDDKGKTSKKGILALVRYEVSDQFITIREKDLNGRDNLLEVIYRNGVLLREQTFDDIRERSNI